MAKLQTAGQKAFSKIFLEQSWGNKNNAGVNYKRSYNKTQKVKGVQS